VARRDDLSDDDYTALLEFRDGLRGFLRWSEAQASAAGLTTAQHQLLLAIRGHGSLPSISDIAGHLLLRHHSVVELVDRAAEHGLVARHLDEHDQRVVRLSLTDTGTAKLAALSTAHLDELARIRGEFSVLQPDAADVRPASRSSARRR
jgi:DNA-binding MarR family transcriptional regulator